MAKIILVAFILLFSISDVCALTVAELLLSTLAERIDHLDSSIVKINDRLDHIESFIGIHNGQTLDIDKTDGVKMEKNTYSGILQANDKFKRAILSEKRHIRSLIKEYGESFTELKHNISDALSQINTTMLESYENFEERVTKVTKESNEYIDEKVKDIENNQNQLVSNISSLADRVTTLHDLRNSDISSLNSRISSLSSRHSSDISSLGSRISTEYSQRNSAISSLSSRISTVDSYTGTLQGRISSLQTLHGQKASFSAVLSSTKSYSHGSTIVFDNYYINHGSAYSTYTGKFTAPYTGTYLFSMTLEGTTNKRAWAEFKKNGYTKMSAMSDKGEDVTGSRTCVTYMYKGDTAWIESKDNCEFYKQRTSFTGVFLY